MITNDYFERIVYIAPNIKLENEVRQECLRLDMDKFEVFNTIASNQLTMPHQATFTAPQLSELLSFYAVVRRAHMDRISRLLILSGKLKFKKDYQDREEDVIAQIPSGWDLVYWGHDFCQTTLVDVSDKYVHKSFYADGTRALAVNNSFYHIFLEDAKVPISDLNGHIRSISLALQIFALIPPLVLDFQTKSL